MANTAAFSKEDNLTAQLSVLYEKWGCRKYSMAKFEEYSFYSDNRDFLTDESIIAFNNSDGRLMALKPDITLSIVKNAKLGGSLTKLYYNESVFRLSESTKDFREIKQTGVEMLGSIDNYLTSETILLAASSLEAIDSEYSLSLSHMAFIPGVLREINIPEQEKKRVVRCVKEKNSHDLASICSSLGVEQSKIDLLTGFLGISGSFDSALGEIRSLACTEEMSKACDELEYICASLTACGKAGKISIDLSVMNNIDYYNGIIFHGYVSKAPARVLSGGRYDNLARKIRENTGAIGFAVYLDNINLYYRRKRAFDADVLIIAPEDCCDSSLLSQAAEITASGLSVRVEHSVPPAFRAQRICRWCDGRLEEVSAC